MTKPVPIIVLSFMAMLLTPMFQCALPEARQLSRSGRGSGGGSGLLLLPDPEGSQRGSDGGSELLSGSDSDVQRGFASGSGLLPNGETAGRKPLLGPWCQQCNAHVETKTVTLTPTEPNGWTDRCGKLLYCSDHGESTGVECRELQTIIKTKCADCGQILSRQAGCAGHVDHAAAVCIKCNPADRISKVPGKELAAGASPQVLAVRAPSHSPLHLLIVLTTTTSRDFKTDSAAALATTTSLQPIKTSQIPPILHVAAFLGQ